MTFDRLAADQKQGLKILVTNTQNQAYAVAATRCPVLYFIPQYSFASVNIERKTEKNTRKRQFFTI